MLAHRLKVGGEKVKASVEERDSIFDSVLEQDSLTPSSKKRPRDPMDLKQKAFKEMKKKLISRRAPEY